MACWIGGAAILIVSLQAIRYVFPWLYRNIIGPLFMGPKIDLRKMGSWALITGATDGIGKAYATQLGKRGFNLILVSRSKDKLDTIASELKSAYHVEIRVIDVDFTHGPEIYEKITKAITGLEIGVLVNNVGMGYPYPQYFLEISNPEEFTENIIRCNIKSVTNMTRIILPQMVERKKGVIVNLSSMAAQVPNPLLTVYSSTKAFVDKFTEDLGTEYKSKGIIIQSVMPGMVVSNMSKVKRPSFTTPSADTYVSAALNTIGYSNHTNGYYPHAIMAKVIHTVDAICPAIANNLVLKQFQTLRAKALRKKQ